MKSRSILCLLLALGISLPAFGHLQQTNPARKAPTDTNSINDTRYSNEYPWLTNDGKVLLWTRQPSGGVQRVYVTYIRNYDQLASTPTDGRTLPSLDEAPPVALEVVNDLVPASHTIKAIAICEKGTWPIRVGTKDRYRITLFMAVGPKNQDKAIYRASKVFIEYDTATNQLLTPFMTGSYAAVSGTNVGGKNETEPMLTRNGLYLFWASNAFKGGVAKYLKSNLACGQLSQSAKTYDNLPAGDFAWRDQYGSTSQNEDETRTTNYHTVIERPNGDTALIFEECHGKIACNGDPNNRDCECLDHNQHLSTTGFEGNQQPVEITSCCSTKLNGNFRTTHPAIAGPRNAQTNSWVLFYMRGKKIWYTKIKESP